MTPEEKFINLEMMQALFNQTIDRANAAEARVAELEAVMIELVHANNDLIDDYTHINEATDKAIALLPGHDFQRPMFTDY